jgi:hypothetical protein
LFAVRHYLKQEDGDYAVFNDDTKIPIARRREEVFIENMVKKAKKMG